MIAVIVQSYVKKKMDRTAYVVILAIAVFVNLGVWLIEQLVKIDFEMLSVSYIISELFLVGFHYVMRENEKLALLNNSTNVQPQLSENVKTTQATYEPIVLGEQERLFLDGVDRLTPTESAIYNFYIEHKTTKEIMAILCIKENTLKFHNKNIYGKLGVSSRKQLMELYSKIKALKERTDKSNASIGSDTIVTLIPALLTPFGASSTPC